MSQYKYRPLSHITPIDDTIRSQLRVRKTIPKPVPPVVQETIQREIELKRKTAEKQSGANRRIRAIGHRSNTAHTKKIGYSSKISANLLRQNLTEGHFPISNGIGIGILSYNRLGSLKRLIESIERHTDLRRTTVFISDDASIDQNLIQYLQNIAKSYCCFTVINNVERGGVAINTNRLLRCLSRFKYGLILNDDVEILKKDWEYFYISAMQRTGMHHFCYRQEGIYGAKLGDITKVNAVPLRVVHSKPHGAVIAFSEKMLEKAGYFDEGYGLYGMEHVDWSMKAWETGLQQPGFFDVVGSKDYFRLHGDDSVVEKRTTLLTDARKKFDNRTGEKCEPTSKSCVPEISYVIPFRDVTGRTGSIRTVVENIRAHRFPVIHIVLVEQDSSTNIDLDEYSPIQYYLAREVHNKLFNKSKAFNLGVSKITTPYVILHDADIMVHGHYTNAIWRILQDYESCHLGETVLYTTSRATEEINQSSKVDDCCRCDRVVTYFEGGSVACRTKTYWKIGGFCEEFWGYGCEDCDFYARLSQGSKWKENRTFNFLHLWHSRVSSWHLHHEANKLLEKKLKASPLVKRIASQHKRLREIGYASQLERVFE